MMKKRKRAGAVLIAAVMMCVLAACGGDDKESGTAGSSAPEYQDLTQGGGWSTQPDAGQTDGADAESSGGKGSDDGGADASDGKGSDDGGADASAGKDSDDGGADTDSSDGQDGTGNADAESSDGQNGDSGADADASAGRGGGADAPGVEDYAFSTNDWKTMEFAWDGAVYTFPLTWHDIEAAGFELDEEYRHEVLESYYYTLSVRVENEAGEKISVRFKNFTDEDREIQDCELYGIEFELDNWQDVNPDVMLCNGVTFGMSADEVKELMGEPDYYYESDSEEYESQSMEYYIKGDSYKNKIELYFWEGELTEITLVNDE
ncbi:MAG: hypothetical protein NC409_07185 [Clostridium sp.]|nr:hypothetical protein [Clostridium sp.]